jgi:hypothetical protein
VDERKVSSDHEVEKYGHLQLDNEVEKYSEGIPIGHMLLAVFFCLAAHIAHHFCLAAHMRII